MTFYEIVNQNCSKFSENESIIWDYISSNMEKTANSSIEQLARNCNFSKASIVRFSKKLGFSGFAEMKVYLKLSVESRKEPLPEDDVIQLLCDSYIDAVNKIREESFEDVFELMYRARRLYLYGSGQVQTSIAKEMYRLFSREGIYPCLLEHTLNYEALCKNMKKEDVVIIISTSGESEAIVKLANFLKLRGIRFISVTQMEQNTIAMLSDANIFFHMPKYAISSKAINSISIMFPIVEILAIKYQMFLKKKHSDGRQSEKAYSTRG